MKMFSSLLRAVLIALCWGFGLSSIAQFPYAGTVVEEVPIPPTVAAEIAAEAGFVNEPKCYRVYVCLQQSDFAVIQLFTSVFFQEVLSTWEVSCPNCTGESQFYQNQFSGPYGFNVLPQLFPFIPEAEFDSWWTIGDTHFSTGFGFIGPALPEVVTLFESGQEWYTDDGLSSIFFANPTMCEGLPDDNGRVLIGQFTTDGLFYGNVAITLSRRTAEPNCLPVTPIESFIVNNVSFSNDPAVQPACFCDPNFTAGCLDQEACNYNPLANCDSGVCLYPEPFKNCDGSCQFDFNQNGVCDQEEIPGCTYNHAVNYDETATIDNGSCLFACEGDFNGDGSVTVGDLLPFLASFGSDCSPQ